MIKRFILLIPIIILFLSACNITQEYTFNKDMSGTSSFEVDMSLMANMMNKNDSTETNSLDTLVGQFEEIAKILTEKGAKNVKYGAKNNNTIFYLNYDFDNIDMLNKLIATDSTSMFSSTISKDTIKQYPKFIKKGTRKLIYEAPKIKNDTLLKGKDLESMKDYYNYTLKFNFATKIRKLKSKKAEISSDQKSLKFSGSLFDILSPDYSTNFEVKLKRK